MTNPYLNAAISDLGSQKIAKACGVTYQAVIKWQKAGRLPRTEWTGETNYAGEMERLSGGRVTRENLLRRPDSSTDQRAPAV